MYPPSARLIPIPVILALALGGAGCSHGAAPGKPLSPATPPDAAASASSPGWGQVASPFTNPPVLAGTPDIAALADKVRPSVVNITTTSTVAMPQTVDPFQFFFGPGGRGPGSAPSPNQMGPRTRERRSLGSGFVIDPSGYVVTNNHVIAEADEVTVRFEDDRSYEAQVVGRDERLDIALLRLQGASNLRAIVLGDSDALRVGEYVVAVGNPFGLGHTVTMGIVSAKDRTIGAGPYDDFIQTDASINPGNSGGPLFNLRGEVVGINTAIHAEGQGIGFAIPVNLVRDALMQLKETGQVSRGKLGIAFQPVSEDIAKALGLDHPYGALVSEVEPAGPAAKAGLRPGDVIVKVDGDDVTAGTQLPRLVARNAPGSRVTITYRRDGRESTAQVQLEALGADGKGIEKGAGGRPSRGPAPKFGLSLTPNADGGVRVDGVEGDVSGKLVRGDVIITVDGRRVTSPQQVSEGLAKAREDDRPALLQIRRQDRTLFVAIDVKQ